MPNEPNISLDPTEMVGSLSVVVPIINEQATLPELLSNLDLLAAEQTIIVDGGSIDGSFSWLQEHWQNVEQGRLLISSNPGRAEQMNTGAAIASGDVLLFLHADSRLPEYSKKDILRARDQQRLWGRFDVAFDLQSSMSLPFRYAMSIIALLINLRSRLSSIATGDQAMFVDAALFLIVGGFPAIPLMEDIALSKVLKRHCVPYSSSLKVTTSARRWQQAGVIRTIVKMWYFRLAYFVGVSPHRLAEQYRQIR